MVKLFCILLAAANLSACGSQQAPSDADSFQTVIEEDTSATSPQAPEVEPMQEESALKITVGEHEFLATFEDNSSAEEFRELLSQGPLTIEMEDYGGFEKVGPLGTELTRNDMQITTEPGDIILYQGNQITIYYGINSWNFTRLARIDDPSELQEKLGSGSISVTFSLT
nr:cyclophilin-like fold protein [uncultured Agathobaculum sp.]